MTMGVHVYSGFERFWHWTQAALILFLALSGFEVHGSLTFLGFDQAVHYHRLAADAFIVLVAFAIFWHFTTGEWRQYVPTTRFLRAQVEYYVVGLFRGAPHPTRRTPLSKLNPLQKLVYLSLKILVIPVMVVSGLLYMLYAVPFILIIASAGLVAVFVRRFARQTTVPSTGVQDGVAVAPMTSPLSPRHDDAA